MGQYQNVPGPSQDEFNAQTQAIANLLTPVDVSNYFENCTVYYACKIGKLVVFSVNVARSVLSIYQSYQGTATIIKSGLLPRGITTVSVMRGDRANITYDAGGYINESGLLVLMADANLNSVSSDTGWFIAGTYVMP